MVLKSSLPTRFLDIILRSIRREPQDEVYSRSRPLRSRFRKGWNENSSHARWLEPKWLTMLGIWEFPKIPYNSWIWCLALHGSSRAKKFFSRVAPKSELLAPAAESLIPTLSHEFRVQVSASPRTLGSRLPPGCPPSNHWSVSCTRTPRLSCACWIFWVGGFERDSAKP